MNTTNIIAVLIVSVSTNWTTIKQHEGQDIQAGLVETNYSVQVELNGKQVTMDAGKAYADELLTRRIESLRAWNGSTNWNYPGGILYFGTNEWKIYSNRIDIIETK